VTIQHIYEGVVGGNPTWTYSVNINGTEIGTVNNTDAQQFNDVKLTAKTCRKNELTDFKYETFEFGETYFDFYLSVDTMKPFFLYTSLYPNNAIIISSAFAGADLRKLSTKLLFLSIFQLFIIVFYNPVV
jgi:hypothetical protein